MIRRKTSFKDIGLYFIIVAVILVFVLLSGRRWITEPMHDRENNGNIRMEMGSNP